MKQDIERGVQDKLWAEFEEYVEKWIQIQNSSSKISTIVSKQVKENLVKLKDEILTEIQDPIFKAI